MQLVAYGAQDVYLTGNPQITLFKVVYRRHTNFSSECIELPIETAKPSARVTVQILRNGDLATKSHLRTTLPDLTPSNASAFNGKVAWVRRLGHALIKNAEVQIGGSQIDKHYGVWLDIWYELTHTTDQERGYEAMIGDVDELTTLSSSIPGGRVLFTPFQFWFCRNYGLALPLIALQYHEVRIQIEYERIENLVVYSVGTNGVAPKFANIAFGSSGILIDYVYLDSEERRRFAQVGHEYLIEQLQQNEAALTGSKDSAAEQGQSLTLNFNHPCNELIWAHRLGAFNGSSDNTFLGYTGGRTASAWADELTAVAKRLVRSSLRNVAAGETTAETTASDLNVIELAGTDSNAYVNTTKTCTVKLTNTAGTVLQFNRVANTSYNDNLPYEVYPTEAAVAGLQGQIVAVLTSIYGGGVSLLDKISRATIDVSYTDDAPAVPAGLNVVDVQHSLTIEDISMPISKYTDQRVSGTTGGDVHVVQLNNYGARLDGKGNIVKSGNIVLNGHDRFNIREGNYFNYVQPKQHHTRTPADGINVYCFGVQPEQHQPTGTANMSRIDNVRLVYKVQDPLVRLGSMVFDIITGTLTYIYVTNYNVLRALSGMAGLAYSS